MPAEIAARRICFSLGVEIKSTAPEFMEVLTRHLYHEAEELTQRPHEIQTYQAMGENALAICSQRLEKNYEAERLLNQGLARLENDAVADHVTRCGSAWLNSQLLTVLMARRQWQNDDVGIVPSAMKHSTQAVEQLERVDHEDWFTFGAWNVAMTQLSNVSRDLYLFEQEQNVLRQHMCCHIKQSSCVEQPAIITLNLDKLNKSLVHQGKQGVTMEDLKTEHENCTAEVSGCCPFRLGKRKQQKIASDEEASNEMSWAKGIPKSAFWE